MKHLSSTFLRRGRRERRTGVLTRGVRRAVFGAVALVLAVAVACGLFYGRLASGPLSIHALSSRVGDALAARIGPGWTVALKDSAVQIEEGALALRAVGLEIRDPAGALVVRAPDAVVSVDTLSLLRASFQPRSIEFRDLQLRATLNPDGTLSFAPADDGPPPAPGPEPAAAPPAAAPPGRSAVSATLASLFDALLEPRGVVGVLDRAKVVNARLTLVDARGRERALFRLMDAEFTRKGDASRSFDMHLDGPRGEWRLSGEVARPDGDHREGVVTAWDAPAEDLLLLSGLSGLPGRASLKVSGRLEASLERGAATRLAGRLEAGAGVIQIDDQGMPDIPVERAALAVSWDEARRVLAFEEASFKAGATDIRLAGELATAEPDRSWRLELAGRDGTLSGAEPGDKPVRLGSVDLRVVGRGEGAAVERLSLRGPALQADLDASFRTPADRGGLTVNLKAAGTPARSLLRLWPQPVTPNVRTYLARNLKAGTVRSLSVAVALDGENLARANAGQAIADDTVKAAFAIDGAELLVAEGLPPLAKTAVTGVVTGTRADLKAPSGEVRTGDGRALVLSDGSFTLPDIWADRGIARVGFRMEGGADALASFLQTPLLKGVSNLDVDPATLKGRADLKVAIPLPINDMPKFEDLAIGVQGAIQDLAVDRAFGQERFEGGLLTVAYDRGSLAIKGEGRLAGSPATIDLRQPKGAPGEAVVQLTLDDAARARKGLGFGSQLTGPLPLKVTLPLGRNAKAGTRVEADLARVGVDGLIPGWTKAVGRPGRLAFTMVDDKAGDRGTELKDLSLDSGPAHLRGQAMVSAEGHLEKAELSAFKLSPGDDMRVVLDRTANGYRVQVRGNVADARPFVKNLGGSAAPARPARGEPRPEPRGDLDLDLAVNILTGHNDEALTNASVKAAIRGQDLRQLQMSGRFRSAPVSARMVPQAGAPVLVLQSGDAGALLRFLDVYRRMNGGELVLQAALGEGVQVGALSVDRFALRNEPALRRIVPSQSVAPPSDDRSGAAPIDVSEAQFTRARLTFTRTASRLDFSDAAIWGPQVGFTLKGWVDYGRDRADIQGTFVPAYGLNNAFAQVPIFGPILGGGKNEGLFAVNFRVSGQATAPTLTVNPLSAIAPGFLRKLFGAGSAEQTGAVPPPVVQ